MIERLTLRNFQAHAKLKIDLSPTITTIVGPSDAGKSSVIRALRWLTFNRPGGETFIKAGTDKSTVTLELDSREIRRSKGKENTYHLDGKPLKAFGADVPEDVVKLLNLSEVNFQQQHDAPFWFSLSAGEVSRQLNQIIDLGTIDTTLGNLASLSRKTNTEIDVVSQRLLSAQQERDDLSNAETIDEALKQVEVLTQTVEQTDSERKSLTETIEKVSKYGLIASRAGDLAVGGLAVVQKGERWAELDEKRGELEELIDAGELYQGIVDRPVPDLGPVEKLWADYQAAEKTRLGLTLLLKGVDDWNNVLEQKRQVIIEAEKTFHDNFPEVCPLCGNLTIQS